MSLFSVNMKQNLSLYLRLVRQSICCIAQLVLHHSSHDCESIQKFHWLKFIQITTEWVNNLLLFMIPDHLFYYFSSSSYPFKQMNCGPQLYNWQEKWLGSRLLVLIFSPINLCYSHYHQKTILYTNVSVETKSTFSSEFIRKFFRHKLPSVPASWGIQNSEILYEIQIPKILSKISRF